MCDNELVQQESSLVEKAENQIVTIKLKKKLCFDVVLPLERCDLKGSSHYCVLPALLDEVDDECCGGRS